MTKFFYPGRVLYERYFRFSHMILCETELEYVCYNPTYKISYISKTHAKWFELI